MNSFSKIIDKIWKWACHKSYTIDELQSVRHSFGDLFPFLSILGTSFSIGTKNVTYFSVFYPKQVNLHCEFS